MIYPEQKPLARWHIRAMEAINERTFHNYAFFKIIFVKKYIMLTRLISKKAR